MKKRHEILLRKLSNRGAYSYQELSDEFDVSTMTIRRDVDKLASQGLVIKTIGGVQKADAPSYFYETKLQSRFLVNREEKLAIAEKALELVRPGQTLFLDGSTTCQQFAKQLTRHSKGLTIVTNSALICLVMGEGTENTVVCIGGQFDKNTASFVGPSSEELSGNFFVDMAFLSTRGFVTTEGTFESSVGNLRIKQLVAEQCTELTLLVDHSKFRMRALCKAIDISKIKTVVTDDAAPEEELNILKEQGKQVYVATSNDVLKIEEDVVSAS
ncbi:MAG: DeoR/GlpR transcriptional regulator [Planctomycetes bacterium]|nr:DeoR/GlpR transcriptional regulator [Planctomycetota bacterium]